MRILLFFSFYIVSTLGIVREGVADASVVRMLGSGEAQVNSQKYLHDIIKLILRNSHSEQPYVIEYVDVDGYYTYQKFQLVHRNIIDLMIYGAGSDKLGLTRELYVPITAGLLGYRVAFVHRDKLSQYQKITSIGELKSWVACQGEDWKDADLLEHNLLTVNRISEFDLMIKALLKGRCDYFPRGIHEGYVEFEQLKNDYPQLALADEVILHYPFPAHIYVAQSELQLYEDLLKGFETISKSGEFMSLLRYHFYTRHIFPIEKWKHSHIIELQNPDFDSSRYPEWVQWLPLH